jgi:TFIIF-interacting CTD phosphatase-like protein
MQHFVIRICRTNFNRKAIKPPQLFDLEENTKYSKFSSPPMELYYDAKKPVGPLLPPKAVQFYNRKTLVLDLDETLVHSSFEDQGANSIFLPVKCSPG